MVETENADDQPHAPILVGERGGPLPKSSHGQEDIRNSVQTEKLSLAPMPQIGDRTRYGSLTDAVKALEHCLDLNHIFVVLIPPEICFSQEVFLSADEIGRASTFRNSVDCSNYLRSRKLLRYFLGIGNLRTPLSQTPAGKPYLLGRPGFSLSRSEGFVAIALHGEGGIGVDVEVLQQDMEFDELHRTTCSAEEQAWIAGSGLDISTGFLTCWTRKEAIAKARGFGLVGDLTQLDTGPAMRNGAILKDHHQRLWTTYPEISRVILSISAPPSVEGGLLFHVDQ